MQYKGALKVAVQIILPFFLLCTVYVARMQFKEAQSWQYKSFSLAASFTQCTLPTCSTRGPGVQGVLEVAVPSGEALQKLAMALDPDVMQYAPPKGAVVEKYKTPCWAVDTEVRCIPYAYIGGSFQSGSADLYKRMIYHKDVVTVSVE
eukprot:gene14862-20922_t